MTTFVCGCGHLGYDRKDFTETYQFIWRHIPKTVILNDDDLNGWKFLDKRTTKKIDFKE
jgi:hypothetical protein